MAPLTRPGLRAAIRDAYDAAAGPWAGGPSGIYNRLAELLVAGSPFPLAGMSVLDLGAGTGAASRAVATAGGRGVAVDLSCAMLVEDRRGRPPGVAGDAVQLPFRLGAFDAVVAAFSLSHLPDPAAGFAEAARVTRAGGAMLASVFSAGNTTRVKAEVEAVAARFGYRRPPWYEQFKAEVEPLTATPDALAATARAGGWGDIRVTEVEVDFGARSPAQLVRWRLGNPALAGFVGRLPEAGRAELTAAAEAALGFSAPQPLRLLVLMLSSRAGP